MNTNRRLLIGLCAALTGLTYLGCGDDDDSGGADSGTDSDTDANTDGDTDTDTDTDTDADTDSDSECDPPTGVTGWGGTCNPYADNCPTDMYCMTVHPLPDDIGVCTPLCCEGDDTYCTDIGSGYEECLLTIEQTGEWWCLVVCSTNDDCVEGTTCQVVNETTSVCYGSDDGDTDADTDT